MRLRRRKKAEEGSVLVRVADEIVDLLKDGQPSPVVILGINEMEDGTHEMVLRSVESKRPSLDTPALGSTCRH